tara:strand:- start:1033 stop:1224 length:192 start_codon:yes stop_codon:yes gene_type:complete
VNVFGKIKIYTENDEKQKQNLGIGGQAKAGKLHNSMYNSACVPPGQGNERMGPYHGALVCTTP